MRFSGVLIPCMTGLLNAIGLFGLPAQSLGQGNPNDGSVGFAIENDLVVSNCVACHTRDDSGRMTRLSYIRKTPEGWQTSIRRMVSLVGVDIDPATARQIIRYLANNHGIAPEELRPGLFEVERRMLDYDYVADDDTERTCIQCHSMGRVITQRRTEEEWGLLLAMHRGYYPYVDFQAFRYQGLPPGNPRAPADTRHPMDRAVEHLSSVFPLETSEWSDWASSMRPPRLTGVWAVSATQIGQGHLFGEMAIEPVDGTSDEFSTRVTLTYARSGESVTRQGTSVVYTGYQWRGRSAIEGGDDPLREVMLVERDWQTMSGRWFSGDYDEFGFDVQLERIGSDPIISGMEPRAMRRGAGEQSVEVFGANLSLSLDPDDVDLGPGISVLRVEDSRSSSATLRVRVDTDAAIGRRDVFVTGARSSESLFVYDEVSSIRLNPEWGMARVGGARMPKGYVQFEARAFHRGPDGRVGTGDDVDLGVVDASWSLEEYSATLNDDDIEFVGELNRNTGLFTPAADGPNPERSGHRNNIGDVWVVASHVPPGMSDERPLRARSHLIVTVPLYMRWDPWGDIP